MNRTISTALIRFTTFVIYIFLIVSTSHADAPSYGIPSAFKPTATTFCSFTTIMSKQKAQMETANTTIY